MVFLVRLDGNDHAQNLCGRTHILVADNDDGFRFIQEFFEKLRDEPERWGKPFAALLGALDAQLELGAAAIGGSSRDAPPASTSSVSSALQTSTRWHLELTTTAAAIAASASAATYWWQMPS